METIANTHHQDTGMQVTDTWRRAPGPAVVGMRRGVRRWIFSPVHTVEEVKDGVYEKEQWVIGE